MTTKTLQAIVAAAVWAVGGCIAQAQPPQPPGRQIGQAASAVDYQRVATYFRLRELEFRAKAQNAIQEYLIHSGPYPMATKTVTRAEVAARQISDYSSKANENGRLAASYDEVLSELGCKPLSVPSTVVSLKDLEKAAEGN